MWTDLIGQILGSNFPTILSVIVAVAAIIGYYFYVLPRLERLKELEAKEEAGTFDSSESKEQLALIQQAITAMAEAGPVDNLDFKEGIDSIYKAMQRFERTLSTISKDAKDGTEIQQEILRTVHDMRLELTGLRQRVQSISGALYQTTGTAGGGFSDLRELQ
ncbi:hypothetical protein YOLOSWAG_90 [Erwinia phage vB_EamM_Yoloswag]|uniref:Uncharacterized protein n=1 Tax=Erwinia phage vB_EamM_Yoloswag TaxID=1958956 RepID=A0A1S6L329_9CAUD|nr:membrane protein [Erwinia phage vB_EamM_Yoloswag]AQT28573.1 hypothetical protein YOLOSWAG_90 [Erwinia phage vB_EamM_Yoloswag]